MRIKAINFLYLILGLLGFKSSNATADILLCTADIPGEVTSARYQDCIDIQSWQWGVGVSVSAPSGGGGRDISNPSFSEVTFTKVYDSTSVDWTNHLVAGEVIPKVELYYDPCSVCETSDMTTKITLNDVLVSGHSLSTGGDLPSESLSLNYTKIEWCYTNTLLKQTTTECGGFDLKTNTVP